MKSIILSSLLLCATQISLFAITVPTDECPGSATGSCPPSTPIPGTEGCDYTWSAERIDGAVTSTDGTLVTVYGDSVECNTCGTENSSDPSSAKTLTYTESYNDNVDASITDAAGLTASLKSAIGVHTGLSYSTTVTLHPVCGPNQFNGETIYLTAREGKTASIVSSYNCLATYMSGPATCPGYGETEPWSFDAGESTWEASGNGATGTSGASAYSNPCP